ncbi:MAG: hypothetical protein HQ500_12540 [Flavobacteriales bacterium]|nr:hypothetical protein [Flavobacteriales bacterium]
MRTLTSLLFALAIITSSFRLQAQSIPTSYFTSSIVNGILGMEGCTGVRVYPAAQANGSLTSMIVGTNAEGAEIGSYYVYGGTTDGNPVNTPIDRAGAGTLCSAYGAKHPKFNALFTAPQVQGWVGEGSQGFEVNASGDPANNFTASGYIYEEGAMRGVGASAGGDPCPNNCGSSSNYVCP